jgi:EF hand
MDISSIVSTSGYNPYEAGQAPQGASKPNMEDMIQRLIETKDQNGNGTLDGVELRIDKKTFNQIDTDGDGELNAEELTEGVRQILKTTGPPPGMPMMKAPDEDNDEQTLLDLLAQNDEKTPRKSIDIVL